MTLRHFLPTAVVALKIGRLLLWCSVVVVLAVYA